MLEPDFVVLWLHIADFGEYILTIQCAHSEFDEAIDQLSFRKEASFWS